MRSAPLPPPTEDRSAPIDVAAPTLAPAEAEALAAAFRAELEAEHQDRLDKLADRKAKARAAHDGASAEARMLAVNQLKERLREQFQQEKGYKRYVDSTGREHWLPPEEYAFRMKRREKRQRSHQLEPAELNKRRLWWFYGGMVLAAIIIGAMIAR
ncbi:MAG: hypothetical protein JNM72_14830 [Deltaproteobacteria bacterium]|jgi:hypothetical protein|nr:hypothetical protein [Deltaproteobacteria bacterium]